MKKIFLFISLLVAASGVYAQGNVEAAKAKVDKSNLELQNPKNATKAAVWLKNSALYADLAEVNTGSFFTGMPATQTSMMLGSPLNAAAPEVVEIQGEAFTKYQYAAVDAYFDSKNTLRFFVETKIPMPDALVKAEASARQAYKLDPNSKVKVAEVLDRICKIYVAMADNNFNFGNYEVSAEHFKNAGKLGVDPLLNRTDVNDLLYFSVVGYVAVEKIAEAKEPLDLLVARGELKGGDVLYYVGLVENHLGNKEAAEKAYIRGVQEFPENNKVLNSLIAFYITNNEDPSKVIPFIKKAQESDPQNAILYMAEGIAYDAMKDYDKAIVAYEESVKRSDSSFDALYNLGLSYYRQSERFASDLSNIDYTRTELYAAKQADIDAAQMKSLGVLLKAHVLNENEVNTVELIRSIYFRQRNKSADMMAEYEKFDAKSKALK